MSDLIQGALQGLLQNRQQLQQTQQQAQQQALQTMRTPLPQSGPIDQMISDYLVKYAQNPGMDWSAMASAIGSQSERSRKAEESQLLRRQAADEQEAKWAGEALKEADLYTGRLGTTIRATGMGKAPSPEVLRTVYNSVRNEAAQAAKSYDWSKLPDPATAREQWIAEYTRRGVEEYVSNWATQPLGPRGFAGIEPQMPPVMEGLQSLAQFAQPPAQGAQQPGAQQPGAQQPGAQQPAQGAQPIQPQQPIQGAQPQQPNVTLGMPKGAGPQAEQMVAQQLQQALKLQGQQPTQQQGQQQIDALKALYPVQGQQTPTAVQPGAAAIKPQQPATATRPTMPIAPTGGGVQPMPRNVPQEKAAEQGAKKMAENYADDYTTVQAAATAAAEQKSVFEMLAKDRPKTGAFADVEKVVGGMFAALGQNPSDPTIQNAIKTRNAEQLISQLTNAALKAEKGVQTKTDEVRIYKEFPKTTDIQKVWDMSVKLGIERAQRKMEQLEFYDRIAEANNGTPTGARVAWSREMENDPLTQYLGGQLIYRSDFIKAYTRKYPDLGQDAAIQKWRELEVEFKNRGGRK